MPTLPNMGLITPTLGGDSGTWDDKINACLGLIDAHDHTSGKGVRVPVAGLNINADFAMGGYAVTGLGSVAFNAVAALTSGSKRLFVSSADNELYWRTNAGTNVKLTSGTSINTTLVGGIVGDYSSVGAEVAFDDANKRYTFKDQSSPSKKWARLAAGPLRIYEYNTTETVYVELVAPAALAASYTVTFPTAAPAANAYVYMDTSGTLVASNTGVSQTHVIPPSDAHSSLESGATPLSNLNGDSWSTTNGLNSLTYGIRTVKTGSVISGFTVAVNKLSDNTNTITATMYVCTTAGAGRTAVAGFTASSAANAPGNITLSVTGQSRTVSAGEFYFILVQGNDSTLSGTDSYGGATITHT